ncbi:hypothetical protein KDN32_08595 [Nocardioides sp. J2M5]|uniref:hypothetical protein n=1 Tax=Nocardioides palaemonis TaxID=2829810 RepID=UPI001BA86647|nr:hypothetical protein [Nocardioides palaemonis]MBS2937801.1 hypothetical protein [Nocardioides palaemonis]
MRTVLVAAAALVLTACGASTPGTVAPAPRSPATTVPSGLEVPAERSPDSFSIDRPPQFHVLTPDGQRSLSPWTICYASGCADGGPSDTPPSVGTPTALEFAFDLPGWTFDATFREHGTRAGCGRQVTVPVETTGERTFRVPPAGPAGDWDVDLFGRGPTGGDAVTTVRWHTPTDGTFPDAATGQAAVLADHDGTLDSYGVELFVSDLDRTYDDASADITVTSADGGSVVLPLGPADRCWTEGSLSFRAPDRLGRRATTLGSGPFDYTVRLTLAGTTYVGRATWPDDTDEDIVPAVPLTWQPALPTYRG